MHLTWTDVLLALGGQTIFLTAAVWLIQSLVSHGMERDLAQYKTELKFEADTEIERLRNTLKMSELEHRVKFSKLHERRAEVIAKLYRMMVGADSASKRFVMMNPQSRDSALSAKEKVGDLIEYFELHRLYFPESVCIFIDQYVRKLFSCVTAITIYWTDTEHPTNAMRLQQNEKMLEVINALDSELPKVKKLLESEFRVLLGAVEEEWFIPVNPDTPS
jgi:hypothetical protein